MQTGCVKPCPIEGLRNLVRMPSMTEIAAVQTARLYEKSMRSTRSSSTPLKVAMEDQTYVRIREGRSTLNGEAELRLAQVGLLQLPRAPLPSEPGLQILRNVCFHYSPCSKQDQPEVQRRAVNYRRPSAKCGPTDH